MYLFFAYYSVPIATRRDLFVRAFQIPYHVHSSEQHKRLADKSKISENGAAHPAGGRAEKNEIQFL